LRLPNDDPLTVAAAAARLELHPKTVLRCIREGRLKAKKIGKSYRILRADVDAFVGLPAAAESPADASVTTIVDVPGAGAELARDWGVKVPAALHGRGARAAPLRADVIYEPERSHLKVILVGSPGDVSAVLRLMQLWLEQPRAESP
jgi:excisionase family DNA binding protein